MRMRFSSISAVSVVDGLGERNENVGSVEFKASVQGLVGCLLYSPVLSDDPTLV